MSISINGFRFRSDIDVFTAADALRAFLKPAVIDFDLGRLIAEVVNEIDRADAESKPRPDDAFMTTWRSMRVDYERGEFGIGGTCDVWLGRDPAEPRRVYFVANVPGPVKEALLAWDVVEEFEYHNATDWTPDGVEWEDYKQRYSVWKRVIPSGSYPRDMLALPIRDRLGFDLSQAVRKRAEDVDRLVGLGPSLAERARDVASNILLRTTIDAEGDDFDFGAYIDRFIFAPLPAGLGEAVADALDPDLARAAILGELDNSPVPDLSAARRIAADWYADGMPEA